MKLSHTQIDALKQHIQTEMLRRGYTAPIISFEEVEGRNGQTRIEFETATFQTIPVMFKELRVTNFSSSISRRHLEDKPEVQFWGIYIEVSVRYTSFDMGSNGTKLFAVSGKAGIDTDYIKLQANS
jgi:hypothetical protein